MNTILRIGNIVLNHFSPSIIQYFKILLEILRLKLINNYQIDKY